MAAAGQRILCRISAPQNAIGPLGHESTLLAHGQPVVHQDTQVPLYRAPLQQEEDQDWDAVGGQKTFLSLSQINALSEQNVEGVEKKLEEFLNFKQLKPSLKEVILIDYYTAGFCWAKEMNFSLMQLSHFMDLLHFLLENLCDKHMTLEDNIKELGKAMAGIGETESERSGNVGVFSVDQAKAIIDFISISLFQPYEFYECFFHSPEEVHVISNEYEVELAPPAVTPFPAPPEEGTSSDIYASLLTSPVAADMEPKESDQESLLGEPSPEAESLEAGAVTSFTGEDQKPTALPNPK